jgi:hypothetical protein
MGDENVWEVDRIAAAELLAVLKGAPQEEWGALAARAFSRTRLQRGTVRNFVCGRAVEHYAAMALMKRSPNRTANWALAMDHSRGGILHSFSDRFKIR